LVHARRRAGPGGQASRPVPTAPLRARRPPATPLHTRLRMLGASVGRTPPLALPDAELNLFAKLEYVNPNGSTKDRSAYWILKNAVERGEITERTTVVESSSGKIGRAHV